AVLDDRRALRDVARRDLVSRNDRVAKDDVVTAAGRTERKPLACAQAPRRDHDVVLRAQANPGCTFHRTLLFESRSSCRAPESLSRPSAQGNRRDGSRSDNARALALILSPLCAMTRGMEGTERNEVSSELRARLQEAGARAAHQLRRTDRDWPAHR